MTDALKQALATLARGEKPDELHVAFGALMDGHASEAQIGALLMGLQPHMSAPDVIAAGAQAMRARMERLKAPANAIDVCGTGGDGAATLNVSTAVAFVLAGCGVPIAKHGNRAMSSRSGAADVLEALGVDLDAPMDRIERAMHEAGVAFLFAQRHHPGMRHVAQARRDIGFRTVFNVLGPLSNPCGVTRQLIGVFDPRWLQPVAEALALLGAEAAYVIHGAGGVDEASLEGDTEIAALESGAVRRFSVSPDSFGLPPTPVAAIKGGSAEENARALRALLEGADLDGAYAAYVLANAALALRVAGRVEDLRDGVAEARHALAYGAALARLDALVSITQGRR